MVFKEYVLFALGVASLVDARRVSNQVGAEVDVGTFENPSVNVRALFRYWLPDASVDPQLLADDIAQLADRGVGGTELVLYFEYGGSIGPAATDWNIYGYGTPAYGDIFQSYLQAHKDNGLVVDFALGPQAGQGVPAHPDELGLSWELVSYNITLNGSFQGQLPGWGMGDLKSAVTFSVLNETKRYTTRGSGSWVASTEANTTVYTISYSSLTDVTDMVDNSGFLSLESSGSDEQRVLYASYARRSYAIACIPSSPSPQNIFQNGSFSVDHFSPAGAKLTISFLEKYVLRDETKNLLAEVGNYAWEDSTEIHGKVYWTPELERIFEKEHGYSLRKYVPLLAEDNGYQVPVLEKLIEVDTPDRGLSFVSDFRATMARLYSSYLKILNDWANEALQMQFSAQVGYNLPVDMLKVIPTVDAPETETLSFSDDIDAFRKYSGPANLAGKRIISVELGAEIFKAYAQTWTDLLSNAKKAFSGGVNRNVIHGAVYSYAYPGTTWPGFTAWAYFFAELHSRHQPGWDVGYLEALNYLGRVQLVLQKGVPKSDLVFWLKNTASSPYPATFYRPGDLAASGYAYEYLSPDNFALETARVKNGVLAPTRQAFKAMIIRSNDTLTVDGVQSLAEYAENGLPIFFVGGIPTKYTTDDQQKINKAKKLLRKMMNLENVHQSANIPTADALESLGITARTEIQANGSWFTRWREDSNGDVYVYVHNDGEAGNGTISFQLDATPFRLDAWSGAEELVAQYVTENGWTTIALTLLKTQTSIFKFSRATKRPVHVVSAPSFVVGYVTDKHSNVVAAKVAAGAEASSVLTLSTGNKVLLSSARGVSVSRPLSDWTLTVEKWLPPQDLWDPEYKTLKINTTIDLPGAELMPWSAIEGLGYVSGIGYYSTKFRWNPCSPKNSGAMLVVPPVPHGLIGWVNGHRLSAFDITNPRQDITGLLKGGDNEVVLAVSTTLWNSMVPVFDDLRTSGKGPQMSVDVLRAVGYGKLKDEGIIGQVEIIPYRIVDIPISM